MVLPLVQVSVQVPQHLGLGAPVQSCRFRPMGHFGSATMTGMDGSVHEPQIGTGEQPIVTL
jgi:hypothetical protein